MSAEEIDHDYTDNAVCPHCGYEDHDSWELLGEDDSEREVECGECGKPYLYCRHVRTTFTTWKPGEAKP